MARLVPTQVNSHQPGQDHAANRSDQGQRVILLPDYLVVQAEDVLPNKSCRSVMLHAMRCYVVHVPHLERDNVMSASWNAAGRATALPLLSLANHQSPAATSLPDMPSCCNDPGRISWVQTISYLPILVAVKCRETSKPRNKILLHSQFTHKKGMAEIFRVHQQMNLLVHRNRHFSSHYVIFGIRIVRRYPGQRSSGWLR